MLTRSGLADPQLRVLTALPVNRENDLTCRFVHVRNNIDDQDPNQLLAHAHGDTRSIPCFIKVLGKHCKVRRCNICRWRAHGIKA
jgi:hypothetical protein